jgi:hypothetical protein
MQYRDLEQWYSEWSQGMCWSDKCAKGSRSVFSGSAIEEKGYAVLLWDGHVLHRGSSLDTTVVLKLERATCIGRKASLCEP